MERSDPLSLPVAEVNRLKAIVCGSCPHAKMELCGKSNKPIAWHAWGEGAACPIGKHPDKHGHLKRWGVRWVGIPAPVRWWKRRRGDARWMHTPGCGCVVVLKTAWLAVRRFLWVGKT